MADGKIRLNWRRHTNISSLIEEGVARCIIENSGLRKLRAHIMACSIVNRPCCSQKSGKIIVPEFVTHPSLQQLYFGPVSYTSMGYRMAHDLPLFYIT